MKTSIKSPSLSILLTIFFTPLLFSQYQPDILRLNYQDSGGEKGFTTFIYNGMKTPYKAIWELADGSRWSVNYHTFDEIGNMVRKYREFSDSIIVEQTFGYNRDNRLIHETFSRSDGIRGEVDYIYAEGRLDRAECRGYNGWFHGLITYNYSSEGLRTTADLTINERKVGMIAYEYDRAGRLLTETWSFDTGLTQLYGYEYTDTGCLLYSSANVFINNRCSWVVEEENYDFSGRGGGPSYYTYDDSGKLVHKTFVRNDGLKTETDFYYHKNGLLDRSVRHYSDGVTTGTFSYRYDENSHLTGRSFRRSDGITGEERYDWDSKGRLLSGEYINFDGWLTGKLLFAHDRYDKIISAEYSGDDGLKATLTFEYDQHTNLVRVHWLFTGGSTQTYWFSYKEV